MKLKSEYNSPIFIIVTNKDITEKLAKKNHLKAGKFCLLFLFFRGLARGQKISQKKFIFCLTMGLKNTKMVTSGLKWGIVV